MAAGLFVNFTEAEVLQILARAKTLVTEGKTIMNYGDQGTSVGKAFTMPVEKVIAECNYALKTLNPDAYGSARDSRRVQSNFGRYLFRL